MATSSIDPLAGMTGFLLVKVGIAASAAIEETLRPLGLRGREFRLLSFLAAEPHSQRELCALTGLDRTTMVSVVDGLESTGLVVRERSTTDRRVHLVTMTDAGHETRREALRRLRLAQEEFLAPLSETERDRLHHAAERLYTVHSDGCAAE
ncbi:DNA-binding MarR family transcriptional regulator [Stackebrandtia albiflava]|uniref:DNA-binding MarR family transcriptional regulator n=1 Tax=Stackebrandtia albiflava TaxID=406432 RepID=A0A562VCN5_9ACTN|nr:MarR family winged helix-turn-helix transcriptional regulator [Stackebrandtia albiflava]TWJ15608.1 DNA-binding MarR family transcriptional regulator [Stackebrandtia albiflava]